MNFTFQDFSSSILNMAQAELPQNVKMDAKVSGSSEQVFAEKLDKILEKGSLPDVIKEQTSEKSGEFIDFLFHLLGDKKGTAFL